MVSPYLTLVYYTTGMAKLKTGQGCASAGRAEIPLIFQGVIDKNKTILVAVPNFSNTTSGRQPYW